MVPKPVAMLENRQEVTKQVVSGLALACYVSDFSKETYDYVDWHWHTEFQLCLVTKGTVAFRVDDRQYAAETGGGIFINSQHVHMARPHDCSEASYFCLDFHPDMICGDRSSEFYRVYVLPALSNAGLSAVPLSAAGDLQAGILKTLELMRSQYLERRPGFELDLQSGVLQAWKGIAALLPACGAVPGGRESDRLKQMLSYIQTACGGPLTLDGIAEHVHLSRSECSRYFRKITGQALFEYISQYRIDKSAELLLQTDMPISEVAAEVGFGSQSYYTECFRKRKRMPPGAFRLLGRQNG